MDDRCITSNILVEGRCKLRVCPNTGVDVVLVGFFGSEAMPNRLPVNTVIFRVIGY